MNGERRTKNGERRTANKEQRTKNKERRTKNTESDFVNVVSIATTTTITTMMTMTTSKDSGAKEGRSKLGAGLLKASTRQIPSSLMLRCTAMCSDPVTLTTSTRPVGTVHSWQFVVPGEREGRCDIGCGRDEASTSREHRLSNRERIPATVRLEG